MITGRLRNHQTAQNTFMMMATSHREGNVKATDHIKILVKLNSRTWVLRYRDKRFSNKFKCNWDKM